MSVEIQEVTSRSDLKRFVKVPFALYRNHPYWIPPLIREEITNFRRDRNPAFEHCTAKFWLAFRDGKPVGRIAGIINHRYVERWGNKFARFGWVDFIDDAEVVDALFGTAEAWAKKEGMTAIHGPLGFTDMDHEGMLVEGFGELGTMSTIYNYPYYPVHAERRGYRKDVDWVEYEVKAPAEIPEKAVRIAELAAQRRGVHVLSARSAKEVLPYARQIFDVINEAYKDLYGYVQLTDRQIDYYTKMYFPNIDPEWVKVLLDSENKVAGIVIAMPSLSRALQKARGRLLPFGLFHLLYAMKRPKTLDLYLGAVRPDLQGKGADAFLITELAKSTIRHKIRTAESNIELEENKLVQAHWKIFDRRQHKRRRCYIKTLA